MATPESLKDPFDKNNGHHDYSESISEFLSDIDDLDDLDLSGIFNSKSSSLEENLVVEDLVAQDSITHSPASEGSTEENILKQDRAAHEQGPVAADPAANVTSEANFIGVGIEAEPAKEAIAQEIELVNHEPAKNLAELQDIETEPGSIHNEADAKPAEAEVKLAPEIDNLQTEVADFEVKSSETKDFEAKDFEGVAPLYTKAESPEIESAQGLNPAELEAPATPIESDNIEAEAEPILLAIDAEPAETKAVQVLETSNLETAEAYLPLENIKAQVNSIQAEANTEPTKEEVFQTSSPILIQAESINAKVDATQVDATQIEAVPLSLENLVETDFLIAPLSDAKLAPAVEKTSQGSWLKRLNLRTKATLLALAIGTLPVVATGTLAYFVTSPTVKQEAIKNQEARVTEASVLASRFMTERYGDIQILSNLPVFANPKVVAIVTEAQKQAVLDRYIKIYGVYDSIAVLDLNGDAIAHSTGKQLPNYKDRNYFQAVLKTQKPFISQPEASKVTGELAIFFAAPVFDVETGKMIAIVRSRMPVKHLYEVVEGHKFGDKSISTLQEVFLVDKSGKYFITNNAEEVGLEVEKDFSIFPKLVEGKKLTTEVYKNAKENIEELVSYSPNASVEGLPELNWSVLVASETKASFGTLYNLELALFAGTAVAAILVGAIAAYIANRATRPIIDSAEAVKKIGRGELDTRVSVSGQDELADLGTNINAMAEKLETFFNRQEEETREGQLLTEISQARVPQDLEAPLNILLAKVRAAMQLDRAVVYRFYPDWSGHIVGESVLPGWPIALADKIEDACIPQTLLDAYKKGRVVPTSDVFNAGFHPDHLELMTRLQIKANLVVPILQGEELFGILVAHHCAKTHDWQQSEIEYLQEAAGKLGAPLGSLALFERQEYEAEQERNRSQALQMELMNLLGDVQGASDGDLTVRADVSAGEIGIVADFFNSIVENLRDIVSQVKDASAQVNTSVGNNEVVMGQLADESQAQAQQITNTLKSVEQMALSIQEVAENARKASKVAGIASSTAESGGRTMDRTVDSILMLRETVAETSKKVKRLGESSQQISKAVSLINQIALQTNLLAINASIEAARAGKEGRGFAVVAEEVGALAAQSAEATKEIEQIVENIQSETGEVVDAMERGTTQVVEGTRQVEEAKESLRQIVKVSRQIDKLLQSISSATVSQTEASEVVKQLMQQVTQSSERASDTSRQVSGSLQETVAIAQQLQASVGAFKVEN
jgi:methyl-accepting chemotaxis protein PixJ